MATTNTYHHGDLRAALLKLAGKEIEKSGYERLELLALAEKAGVTRGAPYRHFGNRDDLLLALGTEGFAELERASRVISRDTVSPQTVLLKACRSFLKFAAGRPQLFRLMFVSDFARRHPNRKRWFDAAERAFLSFEHMIAAVARGADAREIRGAAISCWSALTGFAILKVMGRTDLLLIGEETEKTLQDRVIMRQIDALPRPND